MDTCAKCGYSLHGLPENHICPECGLKYDRSSTVVVLKIREWRWKQFALCVLASALFAWSMYRHGIVHHDAFVIPVLVACTLKSGYHVIQDNSEDARMILDQTGLRLLRPNAEDLFISLGSINRARWSRLRGSLLVLDHDGKHLLHLRRAQVGGQANGQRCARVINSFVGKYTNSTAN